MTALVRIDDEIVDVTTLVAQLFPGQWLDRGVDVARNAPIDVSHQDEGIGIAKLRPQKVRIAALGFPAGVDEAEPIEVVVDPHQQAPETTEGRQIIASGRTDEHGLILP